jgi:sugar lactone lactonase YvrE
MYVDSAGNLYVPDINNHRVLKYISPFTTDTIADEVWGQVDFAGNKPNLTGTPFNPTPLPTASSLCFASIDSGGGGVTIDAQGNLWVANGGNNRVLRFPGGAKTADLVLGQPNFTTGGDFSGGGGMNQMSGPSAVAFDPQEILYVADTVNNRILFFAPPFSNGMNATGTFASDHNGPTNIQADPWKRNVDVRHNKL